VPASSLSCFATPAAGGHTSNPAEPPDVSAGSGLEPDSPVLQLRFRRSGRQPALRLVDVARNARFLHVTSGAEPHAARHFEAQL
jgi:hypothetical protein